MKNKVTQEVMFLQCFISSLATSLDWKHLGNHSSRHIFKQISMSLVEEGGSTLNMSGTIAWTGVLDWIDEREEGVRGEKTFFFMWLFDYGHDVM